MGEAVGFVIIGGIKMEFTCAFVVSVQTVKCTYPQVACVVLATTSDKVGAEAVRAFRIVAEVFDASVFLYVVKSFFPTADP